MLTLEKFKSDVFNYIGSNTVLPPGYEENKENNDALDWFYKYLDLMRICARTDDDVSDYCTQAPSIIDVADILSKTLPGDGDIDYAYEILTIYSKPCLASEDTAIITVFRKAVNRLLTENMYLLRDNLVIQDEIIFSLLCNQTFLSVVDRAYQHVIGEINESRFYTMVCESLND